MMRSAASSKASSTLSQFEGMSGAVRRGPGMECVSRVVVPLVVPFMGNLVKGVEGA